MGKAEAGISDRMKEKETDELLKIWEENNRDEWSGEAFKAIGNVLTERGVSLPTQIKKDDDQKNCKCKSPLRSIGLNLLGIWLISSILMGFVRPNLPSEYLLVLTDLLLTGLFLSGIICFVLSFFKKGK